MRTILAAAAVTMMCASSASAIDLQVPIIKQLYTCAAAGVSRVALQNDPAPCCEGQLKCAQFLSTQGVVQTRRSPRT